MTQIPAERRNPWLWIPSLYFAEGIPYVVVMTVSVIMYKRLGISNADIALYTSWLYLPWVLKPLWSPVVDILKTKRFWIVTMQLFVGAGLAGVALTIPVPDFFQYTLAFFWLLAFSSATHDIAADGFYMLGLTENQQAWFVGVRSTFYRVAMITGQGLLVILAGYVESQSGLSTLDVRVRSVAERSVQSDQDQMPGGLQTDEMKIIASPEDIEILMETVPKSYVDSVVSFVRVSNLNSGHEKAEGEAGEAGTENEPGWWSINIVQPLEEFLRDSFGPEKGSQRKTDVAGNIGVLELRLSRQPDAGEEVVVNFGRESGDNSISLVEGSRFVFTDQNWNVPARAVVQLDPKLRYETEASFSLRAGNIPLSWIVTFVVLGGLFVVFFVYHKFILPYPATDRAAVTSPQSNPLEDFVETFVLFFKKKRIGTILAFLLLFRFAEAQIVKLASPFLLDAQEVGGLALTTGQVGFVYGTVGILALTLGGLLGGFVAAQKGLKAWIWWMVLAINVPDITYIYLSQTLPDQFWIVNVCVAIEQFGYGFGFTAYMLFMIYVSQGNHKTAHYAICTGFMALGMMIPGMFSGWLQEIIGYKNFFVWVLIATIPAFVVTKFIPIDPGFGKKETANTG